MKYILPVAVWLYLVVTTVARGPGLLLGAGHFLGRHRRGSYRDDQRPRHRAVHDEHPQGASCHPVPDARASRPDNGAHPYHAVRLRPVSENRLRLQEQGPPKLTLGVIGLVAAIIPILVGYFLVTGMANNPSYTFANGSDLDDHHDLERPERVRHGLDPQRRRKPERRARVFAGYAKGGDRSQ